MLISTEETCFYGGSSFLRRRRIYAGKVYSHGRGQFYIIGLVRSYMKRRNHCTPETSFDVNVAWFCKAVALAGYRMYGSWHAAYFPAGARKTPEQNLPIAPQSSVGFFPRSLCLSCHLPSRLLFRSIRQTQRFKHLDEIRLLDSSYGGYYLGQSAKTADWLVNNDVKWLFSRNCACANSKDSK